MLFPIDDLLDEDACYRLLWTTMHPKGLHCPAGHGLPPDQAPHDRHREPVVDYRCRVCGAVFNLFTHTPLSGIRFSPARLVMISRGFCQGVPTLHLSQELGIGRRNLHQLRPRVHGMALERFSPSPLPDHLVEADEMYQNAGEKGRRHADPTDPPRRRAHHINGHGSFENDRPPILGVIGRESGKVFLRQTLRSTARAIEPVVLRVTREGADEHTDEWHAYGDLDDRGARDTRSTTRARSGHVTTTGTVSARCTPTPSRGSGSACATTSGPSATSASGTSTCASRSTRACTTSVETASASPRHPPALHPEGT